MGTNSFPPARPNWPPGTGPSKQDGLVGLYAVRGNRDRMKATRGTEEASSRRQPTRQGGRNQGPGWRESIGDGSSHACFGGGKLYNYIQAEGPSPSCRDTTGRSVGINRGNIRVGKRNKRGKMMRGKLKAHTHTHTSGEGSV